MAGRSVIFSSLILVTYGHSFYHSKDGLMSLAHLSSSDSYPILPYEHKKKPSGRVVRQRRLTTLGRLTKKIFKTPLLSTTWIIDFHLVRPSSYEDYMVLM
ncbi:hypothetical protein MSG28_015615 [Choristoneura fumiferana]|uniref:Uncharacterized protein n=1 Tax=Choristoneura fumiferana TaxID=7141 RepID=A0ACC0KAT1_CHOFU|nr:hypothetical protein MSG28_015615 [Choristoneura fumiferana]